MSFFSNWVSKSDEYEWKSLKRGLVWVKNTIEYKRVIVSRKMSKLFTFTDASYDVHNNIMIHTDGAISMGCYWILLNPLALVW